MRDIERADISAKFLLATKPPSATVIPEGFPITRCPARTASGAHKASIRGGNGDGPPVITPKNIIHQAYANRGLRSYAALARIN